MKPYYITTAIDYTNAAPHIGHAYEKVLADVMARFQRRNGREVYFLTGVDQHGQKVQKSAEKAGQSPQEFVDGITQHFTALWDKLNVRYDGWAATTDPVHKRVVQAMLQKLHDAGQLYKQAYTGFYSLRQEQFLTDKERGPDGNFGEEWGEVQELQEENWYFRLSDHVEWLKGYIKANPDFIFPAHRANDVLNALEGTPQDLCISRPIERLSWGIPLPFDERFVNYVWFDALTNYISFAGYLADECGNADAGLPDFKKIWPCNAHVIGKDILVPAHAVYWPIMLHALGFADEDIPKLVVHGWWNVKGAKMSKSLGNVIDPNTLADTFTADGLRHYLMRDIATGYDADCSDERIIMSYNQLAGGLGNLLNRSINMAQKYRQGVLTPGSYDDAENSALRQVVADALPAYLEEMNGWGIHNGIAAAWKIVTAANGYVDSTKPFSLAKDPEQAARLDSVLYHLAEAFVHVTVLLDPIMPTAMAAARAQIGWEMPEGFQFSNLHWGLLKDGHQLGTPVPLFPRVELPAAE